LLAAALILAGPASSSEEPAARDEAEIPVASELDEACDPLFDEDCDEPGDAQAHFPDPWEPYNRGVLVFNGGFDRFVLNPVTFIYKTLLPDPVERAFLRLVENLDSPSILVNDGLQLEWRDASVTLGRFALNTTVGLAGLFDPAASLGLEGHHSDFGQTLTLAGMPSGPYMILPVLGPTTVRDGGGILTDIAMSPLLYILGPLTFEIWRQGGSGLATRADSMRDLQTLEKESIDFYAALRSAFYQNRQAQIWGRREHRRP
jgi:phospholipid-binding lipoprotein MlaA